MKKQTIIICGGVIEEDFVLKVIGEAQSSYIIAVDKGLEFLHKHNIEPSMIVGDFDSVREDIISQYKNKSSTVISQHESRKDSSDTELAIELAISMKHEDLLILGATGNRLDHFLANVQSLKMALDAGVRSVILDSKNRIRLLNGDFNLKKAHSFGTYFSLFPLGEAVENISLEGAKYPLKNEDVTPWNSRCISNEIVGEELRITFDEGIVILMETRD
jgi:thiamine pyrophosphokinase